MNLSNAPQELKDLVLGVRPPKPMLYVDYLKVCEREQEAKKEFFEKFVEYSFQPNWNEETKSFLFTGTFTTSSSSLENIALSNFHDNWVELFVERQRYFDHFQKVFFDIERSYANDDNVLGMTRGNGTVEILVKNDSYLFGYVENDISVTFKSTRNKLLEIKKSIEPFTISRRTRTFDDMEMDTLIKGNK